MWLAMRKLGWEGGCVKGWLGGWLTRCEDGCMVDWLDGCGLG